MHAPLQPHPRRSVRPIHSPARRRRPASLTRRLARQTPIFEIGARIAVNGVLTVASLSALSHLVPYLQTQTARLDQVTQAVDTAATTHTTLKAEFDRYFDPAQASRLMQEYSGYKSPQERHIVWTESPRP
jgi:hypothetical protein